MVQIGVSTVILYLHDIYNIDRVFVDVIKNPD